MCQVRWYVITLRKGQSKVFRRLRSTYKICAIMGCHRLRYTQPHLDHLNSWQVGAMLSEWQTSRWVARVVWQVKRQHQRFFVERRTLTSKGTKKSKPVTADWLKPCRSPDMSAMWGFTKLGFRLLRNKELFLLRQVRISSWQSNTSVVHLTARILPLQVNSPIFFL